MLRILAATWLYLCALPASAAVVVAGEMNSQTTISSDSIRLDLSMPIAQGNLINQFGLDFTEVFPVDSYSLALSLPWGLLEHPGLGPNMHTFVQGFYPDGVPDDGVSIQWFAGDIRTLTIHFDMPLLAEQYGVNDLTQLQTSQFYRIVGGFDSSNNEEYPVEWVELPVFPPRIAVPLPAAGWLYLTVIFGLGLLPAGRGQDR